MKIKAQDQIAELIDRYLKTNPGHETKLADHFMVSIPSISRWRNNKNLPREGMAVGIVNSLKQLIQKPLE